jgi:MFS family permease
VEILVAAFRSLMRGLHDAGAHLLARRTPFAGLAAIAASRLSYGLVFLSAILISRNLLAAPEDSAAGIAVFAELLVFAGAGFALAAVATPVAHARFSPEKWVVICLGVAAASQAAIAASYSRAVLFPAALVLSAGVQGMKIAVDTIVQRDVADRFRGRAFALYDVAFNGAFLLAAGLGALVLPASGYSAVLFAGLALGYVAQAAGFGWFAWRQGRREPEPSNACEMR